MANKDQHMFDEKQGLPQRIVRGGAWLFGLKIASRSVRFIATLILARLLAPSDFGLMGICLLTISLLETFSQTGFEAALVQKKGQIDAYLDSAWIVSLIRGLALSLALFFSAPLVATFFNSPKACEMLRILALCPAINGISNVALVFFRKELDFRKIFVYEITGSLAYATVAVCIALIFKNVWALVWGLLASRVAALIVSYIMHPYRPGLNFDLKKAKELFHFGKWLLGTQIIVYVINQGDNAFVGKMLGVASLGFYALAYRISHLPFTEITLVIFKVMFPAYSKLQDDSTKLRETYLRMLQVLSFFSIPLAGMLFILSYDFTNLFLGEKWLPMVPVIQIFSFSGLLISIGSTAGPFFQGIGKPEIVTKLLLIRLAVIVPLIYPLTSMWGMKGTAFAVLISAMVVEPMEIYMVARASRNSLKIICMNLVIPFGNTVVTVLCLTVFRASLIDLYGVPGFFLLAVIGVLLYFCMTFFSERFLNYPVLKALKKIFFAFAFNTAK